MSKMCNDLETNISLSDSQKICEDLWLWDRNIQHWRLTQIFWDRNIQHWRDSQNISVIETVCIFCRIRWHKQKFQLPATNQYWQQIKGLWCLPPQIKIWHLWTELSTIISETSASFWACFSFWVVSVPTMSRSYCNKVRKVYCKQSVRCTTDYMQNRATLVRT